MNRRERETLARVYTAIDCVGRVSVPYNPADIRGWVRCGRRVEKAVPLLAYAVSSLGYGDLAEANLLLDEAEAAWKSFETPPAGEGEAQDG